MLVNSSYLITGREGIERQRVKPPALSREIDTLIGDEGQNGKQKERERKGSGPLTKLPRLFCPLSRPAWIIRCVFPEPPNKQHSKVLYRYIAGVSGEE